MALCALDLAHKLITWYHLKLLSSAWYHLAPPRIEVPVLQLVASVTLDAPCRPWMAVARSNDSNVWGPTWRPAVGLPFLWQPLLPGSGFPWWICYNCYRISQVFLQISRKCHTPKNDISQQLSRISKCQISYETHHKIYQKYITMLES